MSFPNFKKYISKMGFGSGEFDESYNKMKLIAYYLIASASPKIKRKQYTFEVMHLCYSAIRP
jgi:predicted ATP-binding protein involved in virulence